MNVLIAIIAWLLEKIISFLAGILLHFSERLSRFIYRSLVYEGVNHCTKQLLFLNLGYLPLTAEDRNRLKIVENAENWPKELQVHVYLYENLLSLCPLYPDHLKSLRTLEVGCGAGGGVMWFESAHPELQSCQGIDLCVHRSLDGKIKKGDATQMPIEDSSVDIVINLESSHMYQNRNKFYQEVYRVLKPQGYFCYADIADSTSKYPSKIWTAPPDNVRQDIKDANLKEIIFVDISKNVVAGYPAGRKHFNSVFDDIPWWAKIFRGAVFGLSDKLINDMESGASIYFAGCWQKD